MGAEFIILNLGSDVTKVGASYSILGVADSESEARALLASLPAATASKVAILEKKAIVRRVPSVKLEDLAEDIIP